MRHCTASIVHAQSWIIRNGAQAHAPASGGVAARANGSAAAAGIHGDRRRHAIARAMVRQGRSELTARASTRLNGASPLFLVRNLSFSLHGAQRSVHRGGAVREREGEGEGKVVEPCGHVPLHD